MQETFWRCRLSRVQSLQLLLVLPVSSPVPQKPPPTYITPDPVPPSHSHGYTRKSFSLSLPCPYCIWLPLSSLPQNSTTRLLPLTWMTEAASKDFLPPFLSQCQLLPTVARGNVRSGLRLWLPVFPSKDAHNLESKIKLFVSTDRLRVLCPWPHFLPFS